jgi:Fe-S-cluster-containing dehydrogenase component
MAQYAMVIDLHKCTGCGACGIGCKMENNTQNSTDSQTFRWADFFITTTGKFPKTVYSNMPVLCNHCEDAPCVTACPVTPKAMYKDENGITMHNSERCIGCKMCQNSCPYSSSNMKFAGTQYSVISFNDQSEEIHKFWNDTKEIIPGCTSSPKGVVDAVGEKPPYKNEYVTPDYEAVRRKGVVEKCIFCAHRVVNGDNPYCVDVCLSRARTFGDMSDQNSEVSKLLQQYQSRRLKNNEGEFLAPGEDGPKPKVFYIRDFEVAKI